MISTVTTTTVSTVSTITLSGALALVAVIALLVFLITKEILSASDSARAVALSRALNIAIFPLLFSFAFIAVVKVAEVLG